MPGMVPDQHWARQGMPGSARKWLGFVQGHPTTLAHLSFLQIAEPPAPCPLPLAPCPLAHSVDISAESDFAAKADQAGAAGHL